MGPAPCEGCNSERRIGAGGPAGWRRAAPAAPVMADDNGLIANAAGATASATGRGASDTATFEADPHDLTANRDAGLAVSLVKAVRLQPRWLRPAIVLTVALAHAGTLAALSYVRFEPPPTVITIDVTVIATGDEVSANSPAAQPGEPASEANLQPPAEPATTVAPAPAVEPPPPVAAEAAPEPPSSVASAEASPPPPLPVETPPNLPPEAPPPVSATRAGRGAPRDAPSGGRSTSRHDRLASPAARQATTSET